MAQRFGEVEEFQLGFWRCKIEVLFLLLFLKKKIGDELCDFGNKEQFSIRGCFLEFRLLEF
jgi:hypothetical protein